MRVVRAVVAAPLLIVLVGPSPAGAMASSAQEPAGPVAGQEAQEVQEVQEAAPGRESESEPDGPPPLPDYPISRPSVPCVGERCGSFQLVDLDYRQQVGDRVEGRGGFRLRAGDVGFVGLALAPDTTSATLRTARLEIAYREREPTPGVLEFDRRVELVARLPRLRMEVRADRRPLPGDDVWRLGAEAAVRLSPTLELLVRGGGATGQPVPPGTPRSHRDAGLGLLWQPGDRLELLAVGGIDRLRSAAGVEIRRWRFDVEGVLLREPVRFDFGVGAARTTGRFARSEVEARLDVQVRLWRHFLLEVGGRDRLELGASELQRGMRFGVTLFGRPHRFARGAAAAREMGRLVREARALGYNERRVYGIEEIRALRERLAVSSVSAALARRVERLHRAVVADRDVGRAGLEVALDRRFDTDLRERRITGFVGIPWPLASPWTGSGGDGEVEFLTLTGSHGRAELSPGVTETGHELSLQARLHRELALDLAWTRPLRTALDLALGEEPADLWSLGFRYAFER